MDISYISAEDKDPGANLGLAKKLPPKEIPPVVHKIEGRISRISGIFRDYSDDNYCSLDFHGKPAETGKPDAEIPEELLGNLESHSFEEVVKPIWIDKDEKVVMTEQKTEECLHVNESIYGVMLGLTDDSIICTI